MAWFRTVVFSVLFYGGTVLVLIAGVVVSPVSQQGVRWVSRTWARWFVFLARWVLGIRLVVRGHVPQTGVIVAFKHQSMFETILTLYLFERPAVIMKAELRKLPLWGFVSARHGSIYVERERKQGALVGMLRQARARAEAGRPILIFPEGTRVPVGETKALRAGMAALYTELGVPVVPVALDSGKVWTKDFAKRPGTVTLLFGEPVAPGLDREGLEARVHAAINRDPVQGGSTP